MRKCMYIHNLHEQAHIEKNCKTDYYFDGRIFYYTSFTGSFFFLIFFFFRWILIKFTIY